MSEAASPDATIPENHKLLGRFVESGRNGFGIGKIVGIHGELATVEYFDSVDVRTRLTIDLRALRWVKLLPQTRCYIWSEDERLWHVGRIGYWDEQDRTYEVTLPGKRAGYVPETSLYVRSAKPVDDPIGTLILRANETPFFFDRRSAFVKSLIRQRNASRGLTGLLSSNIDLYAHQAEVARRVLEDPVQRYLLADEVGLGKTIEAGIILRQFLLDEPEGRALVLVPEFLLDQWRHELEEKFHVSSFGGRVQVHAVGEAREIDSSEAIGMLVIDEAHHVATGAYSADPGQRGFYEHCRRLAHNSGCLLLLSATPVLNHERDFLSMLHLLDPLTYRIDDVDAFRERVARRQEIGRTLLSFKEDAHPFVIRTSAKKLRMAFPQDDRLQRLLTHLEENLQTEGGSEEHVAAIRSIRTHISDTYRLHRRMLRNRRESVPLAARMEAASVPLNLKAEYDIDSRTTEVHELLEEWRVRAVDSLSALTESMEQASRAEELANVFLILFRAAGTWLNMLSIVLETRLGGVPAKELTEEFGIEAALAISAVAHFEGEEEVLRAMSGVLRTEPEDGDRLGLLRHSLARLRNAGSKIVVFTAYTSVAVKIVTELKNKFGSRSVAAHLRGGDKNQVESDVERFRSDPDCSFMICDPSGEEGRNLQFADWIVHFDLPWTPNRLEQRIGRLDRIGRNRAVRTRVFVGPDAEDTLFDAWYELLRDGFGIFEKSIASLQFYVDDKLPALTMTLFREGAIGLTRQVKVVKDEIAAERLKISEQNALDEIDALEKESALYFEELTSFDSRHDLIKSATEGYAVEALMLGWSKNPACPDIVTYSYSKQRAILSQAEIDDHFTTALKLPGTYRRGGNLRRPGVGLYRLGHSFIDSLAEYQKWDDRGRAFAMWRHDPTFDPSEGGEWMGFRFDYVVEADLTGASRVLSEKAGGAGLEAMRRRADALFPPFVRTVFVDQRMREVTDPATLQLLAKPYTKRATPGRDYNLGYKLTDVFESMVGADNWGALCRGARDKSAILLSGAEQFQQECEKRAGSAAGHLAVRLAQLRLRLDRTAEAGGLGPTLRWDLDLESALNDALLGGIRKPSVRLDSVGFVIVSGRPPDGADSEED